MQQTGRAAEQHELDFADECSVRLDILSLRRDARGIRRGRADRNRRQSDRKAAEQPRDGFTPPHLRSSFSVALLSLQKPLSVEFVRYMGSQGAVKFIQRLVLFELSPYQDFGNRADIPGEVRLDRRDVGQTG